MKTKLNKTYFNWAIQAIILVMTLIFLYDQLFNKRDFTSLNAIITVASQKWQFAIETALVLLLIPVNWLLESIKWKLLIGKLEKVSLSNAFKAVLTGISVSIFLPNRMGDYLGRVFILQKADRIQATLATILGGLAQLLTTLLFGLFSLVIALHRYFDFSDSFSLWTYLGIVFAAFLIMAAMLVVYLNFSAFSTVIKNISGRGYRRIKKYTEVFSWYDARQLLHILWLSMLRYLIFSFQFYLLLKLAGVQTGYFTAMILIGLVYLMMAVIPTIAMTELGVRGSVSLYIFALYFEPLGLWTDTVKQGVVAASSLLWLLNLAIPALVGAFFVFKLRFIRNGHGTVR